MELFFWHWHCVFMLNWIVWNRTVFDIEPVYLCETKLFEIELFICIKMHLALISYNGWCAIKPKQSKPILLSIFTLSTSLPLPPFLYSPYSHHYLFFFYLNVYHCFLPDLKWVLNSHNEQTIISHWPHHNAAISQQVITCYKQRKRNYWVDDQIISLNHLPPTDHITSLKRVESWAI